jgi:hypothetical protein
MSFMEGQDEVILGALAPPELWRGIESSGQRAVAADLDLETMNITPATVLDQVTVHTRAVYVTPVHGVLGPWEKLGEVTEPRGIGLRVEGRGKAAEWVKLGPGVRGMAEDLIHVDGEFLVGGAAAFEAELRAAGVPAEKLPVGQFRKRDYPGVARIAAECLVVRNWQQRQEEIEAAAERLARQPLLPFAELRREPGRAGIGRDLVRRAG